MFKIVMLWLFYSNDEDDLKDDASETSQKNCDTADSDSK